MNSSSELGGVLMYQLHLSCGKAADFEAFFGEVANRVAHESHAKVLVHFFNDTAQRDATDVALEALASKMPNALYAGCSTSGNLCDGRLVSGALPNVSAVVNVFEDPDTRIEVHQFPLSRVNSRENACAILDLVKERPWVKAIEILTTLLDVGMADFCDEARFLCEGIKVFGGAALSTEDVNMWSGLPYVFSSSGKSDGESMVVVLYGGERLHVQTQTILGWKPLGPAMSITKAKGPVLYELDGVPAFERFGHYFAIDDGKEFMENSIVFPLAIEDEGGMVIKAPIEVSGDGSVTLTSVLSPQHRLCRISYGDPGTILDSIKKSAEIISEFQPQGIFAYSCIARRVFWGDENVSRETEPMQAIAPVAGFYTGGEFARQGKTLLHHNVTLVVAGLREGDAESRQAVPIVINSTEFTRQMAIVNRLAAFVGVASAELEDANAKLELLAKTDGLTGLLNRGAIESLIIGALEEDSGDGAPPSLVMFDMDDFKIVNDAYGHKAGDDAIRGMGELLLAHVDRLGIGSSGRWGGEEFMVLMPKTAIDDATSLADEIRESFAGLGFHASGRHTVSVGVARALPGETADLLCQRVDKALYAAKKQGKNRVVVA